MDKAHGKNGLAPSLNLPRQTIWKKKPWEAEEEMSAITGKLRETPVVRTLTRNLFIDSLQVIAG